MPASRLLSAPLLTASPPSREACAQGPVRMLPPSRTKVAHFAAFDHQVPVAEVREARAAEAALYAL